MATKYIKKLTILKKLFFTLNFFFQLQPAKDEMNIEKLEQKLKTNVKKLKKEAEKLKIQEIEQKIIKAKIERGKLFSTSNFLFSKKETIKLLILQIIMFIMFLSVVFGSHDFLKKQVQDNDWSKPEACLFSLFVFIGSALMILYFVSRCNLIYHSNNHWTAISLFFSFFFILITGIMNSQTNSLSLLERFLLIDFFKKYKVQTSLKYTVFMINKRGHNTCGVFVCTIFFFGILAETYFCLKQRKINHVYIPLSSFFIFITFFYSVFISKKETTLY